MTGRPRHGTPRRRLAPDAFLESFGPSAVILLAERDRWLVVNRAAAELFAEIRRAFDGAPFTPAELASLLRAAYRLGPAEASGKARALFDDWSRRGILAPGPGKPA
jgi:hypothetical protein